jgi:hypothetical protein
VNWNDPFLQTNTILSRDFGNRNSEIIREFPGFKPLYFKQNETVEMSRPQTPFIISDEPDYSGPGQISFFNVANAIQAAANYPSQDFFDICYKDVLNPDDAEAQLTYISNLQFDNKRGYKQAFRIGMVHVIRLLLLPVVNYDKNGTEWARSFDIDAFRNEYRLAFTTFKDAGEIGKNISSQIAKVGKRIDRDMNGNFSNEEILQFLSQKLKNL